MTLIKFCDKVVLKNNRSVSRKLILVNGRVTIMVPDKKLVFKETNCFAKEHKNQAF